MLNRDAQRGRLLTLKEERHQLRVEIDSSVKSILVHFEPLDRDLQYVHNIMPDRLKIYFAQIERKKRRLDMVQGEIIRLAAELNESAD
jgi:hypothetical protein